MEDPKIDPEIKNEEENEDEENEDEENEDEENEDEEEEDEEIKPEISKKEDNTIIFKLYDDDFYKELKNKDFIYNDNILKIDFYTKYFKFPDERENYKPKTFFFKIIVATTDISNFNKKVGDFVNYINEQLENQANFQSKSLYNHYSKIYNDVNNNEYIPDDKFLVCYQLIDKQNVRNLVEDYLEKEQKKEREKEREKIKEDARNETLKTVYEPIIVQQINDDKHFDNSTINENETIDDDIYTTKTTVPESLFSLNTTTKLKSLDPKKETSLISNLNNDIIEKNNTIVDILKLISDDTIKMNHLQNFTLLEKPEQEIYLKEARKILTKNLIEGTNPESTEKLKNLINDLDENKKIQREKLKAKYRFNKKPVDALKLNKKLYFTTYKS